MHLGLCADISSFGCLGHWATTPAWTAILARYILGTRETVMTYSALLPLMVGVVINTGFEPSFNLVGFTACATATCARALKSVM